MINPKDLDRLVVEMREMWTSPQTMVDWVTSEVMPKPTLNAFCNKAITFFTEMLADTENEKEAFEVLGSLAMFSFLLGWLSHEQYGKPVK